MSITDPAVGTTTKESWAVAVDAALNSTAVSLVNDENNGVPNLINGSFESFTGTLESNAVPLNWALTLLTGGTAFVSAVTPGHGALSMKFVAPGGSGNGGGYIQSTDFLPCSPEQLYYIRCMVFASTTGMSNQVDVYWFNAAGNPSSTPLTNVLTGMSPISWTTYLSLAFTPPSDACYMQIRVTGGASGSVAGTVQFDMVQFSYLRIKGASVTSITTGTISGNYENPEDVYNIKVTLVGRKTSSTNGGYCIGYSSVTPGTYYPISITSGGTCSLLGFTAQCGGDGGAASGGVINVDNFYAGANSAIIIEPF